MNRYIMSILSIVAVAVMAVASPAAAAHDKGREGGGTYVPPFAQPLDALDGDTLAQYVSKHQEHQLARLDASQGVVIDPYACHWTVDQLPRTPDAVEGWYKDC
jgi:hypothetical protein